MVLLLHLNILCDHSPFAVFCFLFLFLGFALHNTHAFHDRLFLLFLFKKRGGGEEGKKNVFCIIFLRLIIKANHIILT